MRRANPPSYAEDIAALRKEVADLRYAVVAFSFAVAMAAETAPTGQIGDVAAQSLQEAGDAAVPSGMAETFGALVRGCRHG